MTDPHTIAKGLTKAQMAYLTDKAQWKRPRPWAADRWMTFPPPSTHRVLQALGLVDGIGQLSETGLAVRQALKEMTDGSE